MRTYPLTIENPCSQWCSRTAPSPFSDLDIDSEAGLGLNVQAAYRFVAGFQGGVEVSPSFYDGLNVISTSFLIGYQWD
jgi:hypothetical protein